MTRIAVAAEEETAMEEETVEQETAEQETSMDETTKMMLPPLCSHGGLMRMVIVYTVVNKTLESNKQSP